MVWLTWRQHRAQALVTVALLAGAALLLVLDTVPTDFVKALPVVPALVGLFWGVPLLTREHERGTDCLMWTQSVPRARWLAVKLGVLGVAVTLCGLAFGAVMLGWTTVGDPPYNRFAGSVFGVTGIAAGAWFLALFALGAASGAVLRRTVPAMAVTIAVFAVLLGGSSVVRAHYAEPEVALSDENGLAVPDDAMITDTGVIGPAGELLPWSDVMNTCAGVDTASCMRERGYGRQYTEYHPADRYWRFQWTETGLLLVLSLLLAGVTARKVLSRSR